MQNVRKILYNGIEFSKNSIFTFATFNPNDGTVERQEDKPVGKNGVVISNVTYNARVVSISGTILTSDRQELFEAMQKLSRCCNGVTQAELVYFNGFSTYKASAIAEMPQFGAMTKKSVEYNVNFTLPNFFWQSHDSITEWITNPTSYEINKTKVITNKSGLAIKPIIYVYPETETTAVLRISNTTTSKYIDVSINANDKLSNGDYITIDTENFTAVDNNGVNFINRVTDFEEFELVQGDNTINVNVTSGTLNCKCKLAYHICYIGV